MPTILRQTSKLNVHAAQMMQQVHNSELSVLNGAMASPLIGITDRTCCRYFVYIAHDAHGHI
jgi:hypothetical protein